jgi:isopentenyl-diphosphate delta-isomerase
MQKITMTIKEANDQVVLVDNSNCAIGFMGKEEVHKKGLLHRAISVFIFNNNGELLLQKRAKSKYHSGGLWTNTCCSHPRIDEDELKAAERRLVEEMGIKCKLEYRFSFQYMAELDNGFIENEFDLVYFGQSDSQPKPNENEVEGWSYVNMEDLSADINRNPDLYTVWFKICFEKVRKEVGQISKVNF